MGSNIYGKEHLRKDNEIHLGSRCSFFMDNCLLVIIGNFVLYPASVDSIYLVFGFPKGVERDGEDGINFLKRVSLKYEGQ